MKKIPHVIPYQGSKRKLARDILSYVNFKVETFYEPFVGSGAVTLAAAVNNVADKYVVADKLEPLANLWRMIIDDPERLVAEYSAHWNEQLVDSGSYYKKVRSDYNSTKSPSALLYLVARCVKNAVRFNGQGEFNQGADNRRLGMRPDKLRREAMLLSSLLKGRIEIFSGDFRHAIANATPDDLIYMDPPWQGTSGTRDSRYAYLLNIEELIDSLTTLNNRNIPFMLSFDGTCGDKTYGVALPNHLNLTKVGLNAGRSSQATLLGRDDVTIESLYISEALIKKAKGPLHTSTSTQIDLF